MSENNYRISVCIATYNGQNFIKEQIDSILIQIDSSLDEVIVIDDCSTDNTVEIIQNYNSPSIKLIKNDHNLGAIKSFEKAIKFSKGSIIILSDQDDIWHDIKVFTILDSFKKNRNTFCIVSDCEIIDENKKVLYESFFKLKNSKSGFWNNLHKNRYLGCSMAFRSCIKELILPFPKHINMHDEWIGLNCDLISNVLFLDKVLFSYRRHDKNVSSMEWSGFFRALLKRILHLTYVSLNILKIIKFRHSTSRKI